MKKIKEIEKILKCTFCSGDIQVKKKFLSCKKCKKQFPIVNGIPRFVNEEFYLINNENDTIEKKTKNYFGYEWEFFKKWGFVSEKEIPKKELILWEGGTIEARKKAFVSKCRLNNQELKRNKIILDAGCGNGRYTYEAAIRTNSIVIGVDLGYGSVLSAFDNCKDLPNVIIIQASLFNLPFKDSTIDCCFSNGVLMHTGDAKKAFYEISRTIKEKGILVVHVYQQLNRLWEFNDWLIRKYTTTLSVQKGMAFAENISYIARKINKIPYALRSLNFLLRIQPTIIHMFDWYSAPVASHHTNKEIKAWFEDNNFFIKDKEKRKVIRSWSVNLKGVKNEGK